MMENKKKPALKNRLLVRSDNNIIERHYPFGFGILEDGNNHRSLVHGDPLRC